MGIVTIPEDASEGRRARQSGRLLWWYLGLVLIHLLLGLPAQQPTVLSDELGYLGNARYLAGTAHLPNMEGTQLYHFGYSLVLLPAFWLFSNPVSTYQAVIAVNAFLASSLIVPLFFLLTGPLRVPARSARWIAFTCCLYPPLIFHSWIAWSENAYIPLYAAGLVLFGRFLGSRRQLDAAGLGLAVGLLYAVHPRGAPVIAGVLAYVVLLLVVKAIPIRSAVTLTAILGAVVAATRLVLGHLKQLGWAGGGEDILGKLAERVVPGGDALMMAERMAGQMLYLAQATAGLVVLGLLVAGGVVAKKVVSRSLRRALSEPSTGVLFVALVTSACVFLASCAAKLYSLHGAQGVRAGNLIHGRYNEAAAVVFLAVALGWLYRARFSKKALAWRMAAVVAMIVLLTAVGAAELDDAITRHAAASPSQAEVDRVPLSGIQASGVPGVYPLVALVGGLNLVAMSALAVVGFVVVVAGFSSSRRLGLALVSVLFVALAVANQRLYLVPSAERLAPRRVFAARLAEIGSAATIAFDTRHDVRGLFASLQYLLPASEFVRFSGRGGEVPRCDAVITSKFWHQAEPLGAEFYLAEGRSKVALWLMPGPLLERVDRWAPEGEVLGAEPVVGVRDLGFGPPERNANRIGRWSDGSASLTVNVNPERPPLMLGIRVGSTGRDDAILELRANGVSLWNNPVPRAGGAATFLLDAVPLRDTLTIEVLSDTKRSASRSGEERGEREFGLFITELRLDSREGLAEKAVGGLVLGAEQVLGYPESGFYPRERHGEGSARWTHGMARLRVPLDLRHRPRRLAVEVAVPGRDETTLRIRANGVVLWDGRVSDETWSRTLDLSPVPLGDELLVELESDTFVPAETVEGSTDRRRLGVRVRSIRLESGAAGGNG
jgi:hypothetical protein